MASSSYFYHVKVQKSSDKYKEIRKHINDIFAELNPSYGYRCIYLVLKKQGIRISEKGVRKIMRENLLMIKAVHKKKYSSYKGEISPAVDNVIHRNFHADKPNMKWLTDTIEFHIPAGKLYLSAIIDCFDGMVISGSIGT